ncbi:MAG: hypothetical protein QM698_07285 [Micropepsaceae bacterium]
MSGTLKSGQPNGPKQISETRAKQGRRGIHVLAILLTSLALAIVAALLLGLI